MYISIRLYIRTFNTNSKFELIENGTGIFLHREKFKLFVRLSVERDMRNSLDVLDLVDKFSDIID